MTFNLAPVTASSPSGTIHEPVRALHTDNLLTIEDRTGQVLATAEVLHVTQGTRLTTVETPEGRWSIRVVKNCGCSAAGRRLWALWRGDRPWKEGS